MATPATDPSQRAYRAPCPGCGAPVEFRSAQSTHAVCGYCQSTVVRQGEVLARVGKMAELFDDHSPLQLFTSGVYEQRSFTLIGRLQYQAADGARWTEWHAWFDDGRSGWLAEDNGAYVFSFPWEAEVPPPEAQHLVLGKHTALNGRRYDITGHVQAQLLSAQGELPRLPALGQVHALVELRGDGDVVSIDYGSDPPTLTRGHAVVLDGLELKGLKDESVKSESGRQFNCPHCGAPVSVVLDSSKSITCASCNSLIDLSAGLGAELHAASQSEPINPLIPLGARGTLQGVAWQVVGFQHCMGVEPGDDEHFGWSEYLLYNQKRGFCFLVDSEEGWSLMRPMTGAPKITDRHSGSPEHLGKTYTKKYSYSAQVNYVCGEFYWPVRRDQTSFVHEYAHGPRLLSQEISGQEVVWSSGERIASDVVAKAFGLADKNALFQRSDIGPLSSAPQIGLGTLVLVVLVLVILAMALSRCSSCDPRVENCSSSSSARTSSGSWGGGWSGGHK